MQQSRKAGPNSRTSVQFPSQLNYTESRIINSYANTYTRRIQKEQLEQFGLTV